MAQMTIAEYVEGGIIDLFLEVAEMVSAGQIEVPPEELPGVPYMLFRAQTAMITAWRRFLEAIK